jgi:D-alanyl-D-alanine carboxypeptidase
MTFRPLLPFVLILSTAGAASAGPSLVFDPATGEVLSQERAGEPWYPASLTKLMTAYLVFGKLKSGGLRLDQEITISALAALQEPSKLGVPEGKTVTVDMALQALLVYSANDMAIALAEAAGGTVPAFVASMNAASGRLGMAGTHFANPNGLYDERQVTTARDIGVLAATILAEFPERAHYFSQKTFAVGKRKLANRNALLRQMETADGMKTGFICNSGFNLVASATQNGRKLVSVVFGARSSHDRAAQAEAFLTQGFAAPANAVQGRIAQIPDAELGTLVPADLTPIVCKGKDSIHWAHGSKLAGWGFSLGQYESGDLANRALRGRVLAARRDITGGFTGVVKVPGLDGFAAMVWQLDQPDALRACATFRQQSVPCDVMTPEAFARIAALSAEKPPQAAAQGSDGAAKTKRKKWSSKKKRKG